jgi:OmpA-OmpF porin, OOP family
VNLTMISRSFSALAAGCFALSFSFDANAQVASGFVVNRFEPLDLRGHVRPTLGVVGEYQFRPLALYNGDGTLRTSIVRNLVVLHPGASLVLWERLRLGLSIPLQLYANGSASPLDGVLYPAPANDQAVGDLRISADVRLFGAYGEAFTLGLGVQVWAPTGNRESYASNGAARVVAPRALIAGDISNFVYAARMGALFRGRDDVIAGTLLGTELTFGASAGLRVIDRHLVVGPEMYGSTVLDGDHVFGRRTTPIDLLFGGHYTAGDVRFGAGAGLGLTRGIGSPAAHVLASIEWAPQENKPPADRDHDGIVDAEDACPDVAGERTTDPATNGCPLDQDKDKDGIFDKEDACVNEPGPRTSDPATNGCPVRAGDRDKDGVSDKEDACIDVPGIMTSDPKTNGCPSDRDQDGIVDPVDACPDERGPARSDPKTNGCPDRDKDKDGIVDKDDACPDEPGKADPNPKKNGCPMAFIQDGQIMILEQVRFATSSAKIVPGKESVDVLEAVLAVLSGHAEIKSIRVEGHTDNKGSAPMNRNLSASRATSVVAWLVSHGIAKDRLTSQGFGPDKPIEDNGTVEGRQKNRRVEFHIEGEAK